MPSTITLVSGILYDAVFKRLARMQHHGDPEAAEKDAPAREKENVRRAIKQLVTAMMKKSGGKVREDVYCANGPLGDLLQEMCESAGLEEARNIVNPAEHMALKTIYAKRDRNLMYHTADFHLTDFQRSLIPKLIKMRLVMKGGTHEGKPIYKLTSKGQKAMQDYRGA